MSEHNIHKIVLAYSGGLDTSVILRWLKETYRCPVVAYAADLGQGDEVKEIREKALKTGADEVVIEDLREEFVRSYVWPAMRANACYESIYLLGTSLARPVIAKGPGQRRPQVRGRCREPRRNREGQRPGPL